MLSDEEIKTKRQTIKIKPRTINPIKKSLRPNLERVDSTTSSVTSTPTITTSKSISAYNKDASNKLLEKVQKIIEYKNNDDIDTIDLTDCKNSNVGNIDNTTSTNTFNSAFIFVKKSPTIKKNKKSLETISKIKKDATIIKESICLIDVDKGDDCVNIDDDSSSKDRYKAQEGQVQEQSASNYTANKKIQINVLPIRHPNIQITEFNKNGIEEFEKPINFLMDFTDNFQIIMDVVSSSKQIPKQNLILTYNNFRVFQLGTPASLGITDEATFEIYTKDTYDFIKKQKEHQKYLQLGLFDDQTNNNYNINGNNEKYSSTKMIDVMDLVDVDGNSCNSIGIDNVILSSGSNIASSSYDYLHLKLLEASNTITKLRVKKTLTIQAVMSQFKRMKNLLDNMQFRLKFEDEFLSPTDQVGNTDLEDGDMINLVFSVNVVGVAPYEVAEVVEKIEDGGTNKN
ncbi:337_t:CDS:10 [Entrophospora sp. SA101]|nr:337_t:CDS:10 [Entrophospora sp. SA101]